MSPQVTIIPYPLLASQGNHSTSRVTIIHRSIKTEKANDFDATIE